MVEHAAAHLAALARSPNHSRDAFAADLLLLQAFDVARQHGMEVGQGLVAGAGIRLVAHSPHYCHTWQ